MGASGLVQDGHYHPALHFIILAVEPDLVVPLHPVCQADGVKCSWPEVLRSVISSWDAIIDAESELGVEGSVNFTVMFNATESAGSRDLPKCYFLRYPEGCADYHDLRNMWLAANDALDDFYEPHNDLADSFTKRWVHSISAVMKSEDAKRH